MSSIALNLLLLTTTQTFSPPTQPAWYTPPACTRGSWSCGYREGALRGQLADNCSDERWIGYRISSSTPCVQPQTTHSGIWRVSSLFPQAPSTIAVPAALQRFCVYEWVPLSRNARPVVSALPNQRGLRLERDCHVVTPLAPVSKPTALALDEAHADAIDRPVYPTSAPGPSGSVMVAVVDTSPRDVSSGLPRQNPFGDTHGFDVAAAIYKESCRFSSDGLMNCAADIRSFQGLPRNGGASGHPSEVGVAMFDAMVDWLDTAASKPMVMNLSLGWDGTYSGPEGPDMRITALAPWLVAQWARCEGALLIAAAGNLSQIGSTTGAMYPAAWESEPSLCPSSPAQEQAVYAVGALQQSDEPLRIAIPGSMPGFLAPGAFVAHWGLQPNGSWRPTDVRSGSSMAAAVVSGLAAHILGHEPNRPAHMVMRAIRHGGVPLGRAADLYNPVGSPPEQVRINACAAVRSICLGTQCPQGCRDRAAGAPAPFPADEILDLAYPGLRTGPTTPATLTPMLSMPTARATNIEPTAGPLPIVAACPLCYIHNLHLYGRMEFPEDEHPDLIVLRFDNCDVGWCGNPDQGGLGLVLPAMDDPFKIDLTPLLGAVPPKTASLESYSEGVVKAVEIPVFEEPPPDSPFLLGGRRLDANELSVSREDP